MRAARRGRRRLPERAVVAEAREAANGAWRPELKAGGGADMEERRGRGRIWSGSGGGFGPAAGLGGAAKWARWRR